MPGRSGAVMAFLVLLLGAGRVSAHALEADFRVLPAQTVRIEAWFETDDPAPGAKVQVFRSNKELLVEGKTDKDGVFHFTFPAIEPLEVKIDAGQGHGKTLTISADALSRPSADTGRARPDRGDTPPGPKIDRHTAFPIREVVLGVTFLLAAAAFVISLRNAQALKRLQAPRGGAPGQ
jgi:hypothetical protein